MVTIKLPTVLRRLANDQAEVPVQAATVQEALSALAEAHPQLGGQLLAEGRIRPFVRVFVGADDIEALDGAQTRLAGGEQLRIVPAIAGGQALQAGQYEVGTSA